MKTNNIEPVLCHPL